MRRVARRAFTLIDSNENPVKSYDGASVNSQYSYLLDVLGLMPTPCSQPKADPI